MPRLIKLIAYCSALLIIQFLVVSLALAEPEPYTLSPDKLRRLTSIPHLRVVQPSSSGEDPKSLWRDKGVRVLTLARAAALGQYACQAPSTDQLNRHLSATLAVLGRYPKTFFERSKMRFLVVCGALSAADGGRPGAIPNAALGVLVMDLSYRRSLAGYRAGLHHELYHMFDYALDGGFVDPDWARLNPLGFRYRGHGRLYRNASSQLGSGGRGFVTEYAQAAVEEDKAELVRALITEAKKTKQLARQDAILRQKIDRLKTELEQHGGLDGRFWRR